MSTEAFTNGFIDASNKFQEAFNTPGYIPGVSTLTGLIRTVCSVVLGIFASLAALVTVCFDKKAAKKLADAAGMHFLYACRGLGEAVPLVGNLAFYLLDKFVQVGSALISR
jgi:hypothetical protein